MNRDIENIIDKYEQLIEFNHTTIDSLKDQIEHYQKRIEKFKKIWCQSSKFSTDQNFKNLQLIIVKLEEELSNSCESQNKKLKNVTEENKDLRLKILSLEKMIISLAQCQNDNQLVLSRMQSQSDQINELKFQNQQMRETLKSRHLLEKRIKELKEIEQKEKAYKEKQEKELKKQRKLEQQALLAQKEESKK